MDVCTPQGDHWASTATGHPKVTLSSESLQVRDKWESDPAQQHSMHLLLSTQADIEQRDNKKWLGTISVFRYVLPREAGEEEINEEARCGMHTTNRPALQLMCKHVNNLHTGSLFLQSYETFHPPCNINNGSVYLPLYIPNSKIKFHLEATTNLTSVSKHFTQL